MPRATAIFLVALLLTAGCCPVTADRPAATPPVSRSPRLRHGAPGRTRAWSSRRGAAGLPGDRLRGGRAGAGQAGRVAYDLALLLALAPGTGWALTGHRGGLGRPGDVAMGRFRTRAANRSSRSPPSPRCPARPSASACRSSWASTPRCGTGGRGVGAGDRAGRRGRVALGERHPGDLPPPRVLGPGAAGHGRRPT